MRPIRTLKVFESFGITKSTLATDGDGHILVIDGGGSLRCAMLGDKLVQLAIDHNWKGVVLNGCLRDSAAISALPIGIKALTTNPTRPSLEGEGRLDNRYISPESPFARDIFCMRIRTVL